MDPEGFPLEFFQLGDDSAAEFYVMPRLVVRIDAGALAVVRRQQAKSWELRAAFPAVARAAI